jgi:hypothetical protein
LEEEISEAVQQTEAKERSYLAAPRDSNPDMLIQSQISPSENKGNKDLQSAKRDQTRQNTQTGRKRNEEGGL